MKRGNQGRQEERSSLEGGRARKGEIWEETKDVGRSDGFPRGMQENRFLGAGKGEDHWEMNQKGESFLRFSLQ